MTQEPAAVVFASDRLDFRCIVESDAKAMEQVLCDEDVMKYSMGTLSNDQVKDWISRCMNDYAASGFGNWAVVLRCTGDVIGYCGVTRHMDRDEHGVSLNYRLARSCWGQGMGTEAVVATIAYAKDALNLHRIYATIEPDNVASIRVATKAGMAFEKTIRLEDYDYPDYLYSIDLT